LGPATAIARTAYVADAGTDSVTPIDTATNTPGASFSAAGSTPEAIAFTPDGKTAYVANLGSDTVTAFDTATNALAATIPVGNNPSAIAITPDGKTAYVTNAGDDNVTPIDTATNTALPPSSWIDVGPAPFGIAITPNGNTAYVANDFDASVTPINIPANTTRSTIAVGNFPVGMAITPNGTSAYVANNGDQTVTPINTATDTPGAAIAAGDAPIAIAITPHGGTAYVANCCSDDVSPIDTSTNIAGPAIDVGANPQGIAMTPDGHTAYVVDTDDDDVTPIHTATNTTGPVIPLAAGSSPFAIAIVPDQPPHAAFAASPGAAGQPTSFDASGSTDPDGSAAMYAWDFGDGSTARTSSPTTSHTYAGTGNYTAALTVTDNEGCSTAFVFTGQTALCNGSAVARTSRQVTVAEASPGLITNASPDIALGGSVHDTATLAGGSSPTGEIAFNLYGPDDSLCSGSPVFTDMETVSGNGDYTSDDFTPTAPGTYRWTASYSGDSDNDPVSTSCNDANESVTVEPPTVENFRLDPQRFQVKDMNTPIGPPLPKIAEEAPRGSTIKLTLNTDALIHFSVARPGSPPRHNPHRHGFNRDVQAGHNSVPFTGKLYGKALRPGHFQLYARAVGDSGARFKRASAPFTIVAG